MHYVGRRELQVWLLPCIHASPTESSCIREENVSARNPLTPALLVNHNTATTKRPDKDIARQRLQSLRGNIDFYSVLRTSIETAQGF